MWWRQHVGPGPVLPIVDGLGGSGTAEYAGLPLSAPERKFQSHPNVPPWRLIERLRSDYAVITSVYAVFTQCLRSVYAVFTHVYAILTHRLRIVLLVYAMFTLCLRIVYDELYVVFTQMQNVYATFTQRLRTSGNLAH